MRYISLYTLHPSPKTTFTYVSKHSHSIASCSRAPFDAVKIVVMNRKKVVFQAGRTWKGERRRSRVKGHKFDWFN